MKQAAVFVLMLSAAALWAQTPAEAAAAAAGKAFEAMMAERLPADRPPDQTPAPARNAAEEPASAARADPAVAPAPADSAAAETDAGAAPAAIADEDAPELDIETFLRTRITLAARQHLGVPYKTAGAGPDGFDCSGLVYFAYREAAGMELSRSTAGLWNSGKAIAAKDAKPGDVLIFTTVRAGASHAGIVLENGEAGIVFIHAASQGSRTGVIISRLNETYYRSRFMGARTYF
ncbi:MAG: C40 family peptidase [Treponema sp.]|jgi:cell wall-associated NlpC family hydrolase|nr:C40 family peptidase [Treponema sp.]